MSTLLSFLCVVSSVPSPSGGFLKRTVLLKLSIVTLQLTISFCTKRTKLFRTLEVGIFNSQMQQHGRPSPDHWRRVLVSPKFLNTIHSSKYNSQLQQHRRAVARPLAQRFGMSLDRHGVICLQETRKDDVY